MAFSLFGNKKEENQPNQTESDERLVRPMEQADINPVIDMIYEHDEDDAEEAREDFEDSLEGMFVAVDHGRIVGVTGAFQDEEAEDIYWLSWTYVEKSQQRQGIGRYLVGGLLDQLHDQGIRKVFISTGDYMEDGVDIYAAAKAFYENLGARLELQVANYCTADEARFVYGLDIVDQGEAMPVEQAGHVVFDGLYEAPESEDGLTLTWHLFETGEDIGNPKEKLEALIMEARDNRARFLSAAIPADLSEGAAQGLEAMGFKPVGALKDYYEPNVDQLHWMLGL